MFLKQLIYQILIRIFEKIICLITRKMLLNSLLEVSKTPRVMTSIPMMSPRMTNRADAIRKNKALLLKTKIQQLQMQREMACLNNSLEFYQDTAANTTPQYLNVKQSQMLPSIEQTSPNINRS